MLKRIVKSIRNLKRVHYILFVFAKYGFRDIVERLPVRIRYKGKEIKGTRAERLRMAIEELGPTFIKIGQILSLRPDLLPEDFIVELSKLQERVKPVPFEEIKDVIEKEFKMSISDIFPVFEKQPHATASLAQVHRAKIKEGVEVVVKVQRPKARNMIESDFSIIRRIAEMLEKRFNVVKEFDVVGKIEEIGKNLLEELDFIKEGKSIERFKNYFKNDENVIIPSVYREYTTGRVLTMERVEGINIKDIDRVSISSKEIARRIADFFFTQIFDYGYFHADPHPGNIMLSPDGRIILLDFGLIGRIDETSRDILSALLIAIVEKDVNKTVEIFLNLGVIGKETDIGEIKEAIKDLMDRYYGIPLSRISIKRVANEIFDITRRYKMKMPRNFVLLAKSLSTLEGVIHQVYPEFEIIECLKVYAFKLLERRYNLEAVLRKTEEIVSSYGKFLEKFPEDVRKILEKLKEGKLKMEMEHKGLEAIASRIERALNRLSFSLIMASIVIGSSLIVLSNRGPFLFNLPAFGIIGFILAGLSGFGLLITLLRSRRL